MTSRRGRRGRPTIEEPVSWLLVVAIWFALLTGLADVLVLGVQSLLHHKIRLSPLFVWMAPVANMLLFATAGLALSGLKWRWPRLVSLRIAVFVYAFLGFLSLLFLYPRLHRLAMVLLATGLALQIARFVAARAGGFQSLIRRTIWWLAAVVLVLGLSVHGLRSLTERRALAKLPPSRPNAPSVLLIVLDTVRAQNLSLYGYGRPTSPQLERLARGGVRFEWPLSTAPWTLPSHASMFTGRFPHELSADWLTPFDDTHRTLGELLQTQGYLTAGFVANVFYCTYEDGLDRGFIHYEDYPISLGQILNSSSLGRLIFAGLPEHNANLFRRIVNNYDFFGRKSAKQVNEDFLDWLSRNEGRPFFAFLNFIDAHLPYAAPEPFDKQFGPTEVDEKFIPRLVKAFREPIQNQLPKRRISRERSRLELNAYDGSIAYIDHELGLLFAEMERRGVLENTLVIVTSDHGEQFGEHGLSRHGNSLYLQLLHVPLILSFPGRVPAGEIISEPVTLRDLAATVLDLVNIHGQPSLPGSSLSRFWDRERNLVPAAVDTLLSEVSKGIRQQKWVPVSKGDMKSLVLDGRHYIKNGDGREELYDLRSDSQEERNLADREAPLLPRFRTLLTAVLGQDSPALAAGR